MAPMASAFRFLHTCGWSVACGLAVGYSYVSALVPVRAMGQTTIAGGAVTCTKCTAIKASSNLHCSKNGTKPCQFMISQCITVGNTEKCVSCANGQGKSNTRCHNTPACKDGNFAKTGKQCQGGD